MKKWKSRTEKRRVKRKKKEKKGEKEYGVKKRGREGKGQILKRLASEETCVWKKSTFPEFDGPSCILLSFYGFLCTAICSIESGAYAEE